MTGYDLAGLIVGGLFAIAFIGSYIGSYLDDRRKK